MITSIYVFSILLKHSVSHVVGYMKGKNAITIARKFRGKQRNFNGEHFWARGYFVSTVGLDADMVKGVNPTSGAERQASRSDDARSVGRALGAILSPLRASPISH